jgi:mono/diheme cytochrome c family protein
MSLRLTLSICIGFACLLVASSSTDSKAQEKKTAEKAPSYSKAVAPLLKDACASCHSGAKRKAGLDVTSYDSLMKFVKAGDPANSKLHKSLTGKGGKLMPPKNPLADDQVELVKAWIANGAKKD